MKIYGLIGFPLEHSFSQKYFTQKFQNENIRDVEYSLFPLRSIREFPDLIKIIPELAGLNVTIPYKEAILKYLDETDYTVKEIGAVNTIKIVSRGEKKKLTGYNTDIYGIEKVLAILLKPVHQKALILGTGGVSKAVQYFCKSHKIEFTLVSRTPGPSMLSYNNLNSKMISENQLIINTTPSGMFPGINNCPPIPYKSISRQHLLIDLIYNPAETLFLKKGKEQGALTVNGIRIFELQAEKAWEIWNLGT